MQINIFPFKCQTNRVVPCQPPEQAFHSPLSKPELPRDMSQAWTVPKISVDKKTTKTSSKIPRKSNENWWQLKRSDAVQGPCDQPEHYPKFPLRRNILRVDEKINGNSIGIGWPLKGTGVETRPTPGKSQQELPLGHDWLQFLTPNLDPAQDWRPVLLKNTYFHAKNNKMQQKPCKSEVERGAGNRIRFPLGPLSPAPQPTTEIAWICQTRKQ